METKIMHAKVIGKGKGARVTPFPAAKFDVQGISINPKTRDVVIEYTTKKRGV